MDEVERRGGGRGLHRHELHEVDSGDPIGHAFRVTVRDTDGYVRRRRTPQETTRTRRRWARASA